MALRHFAELLKLNQKNAAKLVVNHPPSRQEISTLEKTHEDVLARRSIFGRYNSQH